MLAYLRTQLTALREARSALRAELDGIMAAPQAEARALTPDETRAFDDLAARITASDSEIAAMEARISDVEAQEERAARAGQSDAELGRTGTERSSGPARVLSEPEVYRRGGNVSYFRDVVRAQIHGSRDSQERLERNNRQVMEQRALTTVDGAGGDFVPPLWMVDQWVNLARAARPTADLIGSMALPAGTDSINLPKLTGGTATAEQTTQNTAVQNTDATTGAVTAAVTTIAGQQVVSLQLIEQSPVNMDQVLLQDLARDYATKVDVFVLNNNAANKRGLLNVSGINAVTYTDATPTLGELYPKIADGIQRIHTLRFLPPNAIVMHPRRWAWGLSQLDSAGRPLFVPSAQGPLNAVATQEGVSSQGFVGTVQGVPVYVDPSVPINLGAGTNEDRIIIFRTDDILLFEQTPRAEAFRETYAQNLSVLLRFYNYVALHSERYPAGITAISGTGLITPTF
jgi:HK97 family phage major capsid protein